MAKIVSVSLPDIMYEHIKCKGISRSSYIKALIAQEMTNPMTPQELMTGIGISSMLQSGTTADNLKLPKTEPKEKKETERKESPLPSKQIISTPPSTSLSSEPKSVPVPEIRKVSEAEPKQEYLNRPSRRSRLDEGLPY